VLVAVREHEPMHLRTAPLIFLSTCITHLVGGSAGREGAALQLGASISNKIAHAMGVEPEEGRMLTVCGMAAAFSALFGTPLTAALFALEWSTWGSSSTPPCPRLSLLPGGLSAGRLDVCGPTAYAVSGLPGLAAGPLVQVIVLGGLCALLSILFCKTMHTVAASTPIFARSPAPAVVGGCIMVALSLLTAGWPTRYTTARAAISSRPPSTGTAQGWPPGPSWSRFSLPPSPWGGFRGARLSRPSPAGPPSAAPWPLCWDCPPSFGGAVAWWLPSVASPTAPCPPPPGL
jgi:H+/Cl- antiporter ClcA